MEKLLPKQLNKDDVSTVIAHTQKIVALAMESYATILAIALGNNF
jgi:hypothetical protein